MTAAIDHAETATSLLMDAQDEARKVFASTTNDDIQRAAKSLIERINQVIHQAQALEGELLDLDIAGAA